MRLSLHILGLHVFAFEWTAAEAEDDDTERDLSGGTLGTERIEAGTTDRYLGFTGGWESE